MDQSKVKRYVIIGFFAVSFFIMKFALAFSWMDVVLFYLVLVLLYAIFNIWAIIAFTGNYLFNTGNQDKAVKIFKFCIKHNCKYPTVYLNYSIVLVKEGKAAEALSYLEKAITKTPKIITEKNIILTMGSCYWVLGEIDKAIETLEGLRKKYEYVNAHVLTTLAFMYFLKGNTDMALDLTQKAIEDSPESGAAWDNLGQIKYKNGQIAEAKEAFLKALEYKSDLADSLYYMAKISEDENDLVSAKDYFQKAENCKISSLNTVTAEQIREGYQKYFTA